MKIDRPRAPRSPGTPSTTSSDAPATLTSHQTTAEKTAETTAPTTHASTFDPHAGGVALGVEGSAPVEAVPVGARAGRTAAVHLARKHGVRHVAAIDLGSSSGKMLIQRHHADGTLTTVLDVKIGAGLGKGVTNGQPIPPDNQARALDALRTFVEEAARRGVAPQDIPMITTAVVRNASNGAAFLDAVHALGLTRARVLSGEDEAAMGFRGALTMLGGTAGRFATLDLGGGSFQMAVGTHAGLEQGGSTQIGSNFVLDQLLAPRSDAEGRIPPDAFRDVDAALVTHGPMPLDAAVLRGRTLVATGGVSKFLRAHLHKDIITRADVDALRREMGARTWAERVAPVQHGKDLEAQRALGIDTTEGALDYGKKLPASASLLLHIMTTLGLDEVRVSETDARHALIAAHVAEPADASP